MENNERQDINEQNNDSDINNNTERDVAAEENQPEEPAGSDEGQCDSEVKAEKADGASESGASKGEDDAKSGATLTLVKHGDKTAADADEDTKTDGGTTITKTLPGSPAPTPATQVRADNRKHTTTPADENNREQPRPPKLPRGQAHVQQIASSLSQVTRHAHPTIHPIRARVPPKLVRLATVTVSSAKARPIPQGPSLFYEEPRRPKKVITWDAATNARPPLRIDMEGPGPCSYSPTVKPLSETNSPSYTFGSKCYPEKTGGSRTSWGKSWFQSNHVWHNKADYSREGLWPSPTHYPKPSLLGLRQRTMYEAPSYTFGHRHELSIIKRGSHKEPSPNDYERQTADSLILRRAPSFTHQFRREGTVLWGENESNPGPCAYNPALSPRHQQPAFTIQGIRRDKSHTLGPYSTF